MLSFKLWLEASGCELVKDPGSFFYKLIGNTYPYRNELGKLGFHFDYKTGDS